MKAREDPPPTIATRPVGVEANQRQRSSPESPKFWDDSIDMLATGGRLCVISFHSLEDRIVKRFMRDQSREPEQYRGMPNIPEEFRPKLRQVGKAITATAEEIADNVRARSARLRIAERL